MMHYADVLYQECLEEEKKSEERARAAARVRPTEPPQLEPITQTASTQERNVVKRKQVQTRKGQTKTAETTEVKASSSAAAAAAVAHVAAAAAASSVPPDPVKISHCSFKRKPKPVRGVHPAPIGRVLPRQTPESRDLFRRMFIGDTRQVPLPVPTMETPDHEQTAITTAEVLTKVDVKTTTATSSSTRPEALPQMQRRQSSMTAPPTIRSLFLVRDLAPSFIGQSLDLIGSPDAWFPDSE